MNFMGWGWGCSQWEWGGVGLKGVGDGRGTEKFGGGMGWERGICPLPRQSIVYLSVPEGN